MAEKKVKEKQEEDDFDPSTLEERIKTVIPNEAQNLQYRVMGTYYKYMGKNKEEDGRIKDFRLSSSDAKSLAEQIMGEMREHVLTRYLLAQGVKYDTSQFDRKGADALVRLYTGLDENSLKSAFENKEVTVELMQRVGGQAVQRLGAHHRDQILGELSDYDNLEKARKHIQARLAKHGLSVHKPERIGAGEAYEHLGNLAGGIDPDTYHKRYADHIKRK